MFIKNSSPNGAAEAHFTEPRKHTVQSRFAEAVPRSSRVLEQLSTRTSEDSLAGLKPRTQTEGPVTPRVPTGPLQCGLSDDTQGGISG